MPKRRKKIARADIHKLRGSLKGGHALRTLEEERAKDRAREEAKIAYWAKKRKKRPRQ